MNKQAGCALIVLAALLGAHCSRPGPPYSPGESLKMAKLPEGYRLELVAAEPAVVDPVAIAFDEQARMYVVEMIDYPLHADPLGRVKRLEDTDGDGSYEASTVFADGIHFPNGVMRWREGILVTAAPDILYFEDTDGDGKADKREVVLTGFAATNPQLRVNGLRYGLDNWIYVNYPRVILPRKYVKEFGDAGGKLHFPGKPDSPPRDIRAEDVRFRPDQAQVEPLGGISQYGNSFDHWGNRFTVWNNDYLRHLVIETRYLENNPYLAVEKAYQSVSGLDHSAEVYPVTENPLVIHDSQVGHFTSACGMSIYTGGILGEDFEGNALTCEPVHNLIRRSKLSPLGATFLAQPAYENKEFLASTDSWFRPVFTTTGPDGALYLADYYRFTVEHPEFVPPELSKQIEFESRRQLGRIYRVVHESSTLWPRVNLAQASTAALVENLRHPNLWRRTESQRLLLDRKDTAAVEPLRRLAAQPESAVGRIHALWALDGFGALDNDSIASALRDPHPGVRRQAIRMAELRLPNPALAKALLAMQDETDPQVGFQLVLTLSLLGDDRAFPLLRDTALRHIDDAWFRIAALTSAADDPGRWFQAMMNDSFCASDSPGKRDFVRRLASILGARDDQAQIAGALRAMASRPSGQEQSWWRIAALEGLGDGIQRAAKAPFSLGPAEGPLVGLLTKADPDVGAAALELAWRCGLPGSPALRQVVERGRRVAGDSNAGLQQRCFAAGVLALSLEPGVARDLVELLSSRHPPEVRLAVVRALRFSRNVDAADEFTRHWREFSAPMRDVAATWFFEDSGRLIKLLDAIQDGKVQTWSLGPGRRRALEGHQDERIRQRAALVLQGTQEPDRQAVYEKYLPAIRQEGDAQRGLSIFRRHCAECHKIQDTGFEVGPDLLSVSARYKEVLLADILIPNQSIEAGYEEYMIEASDGRLLTGVVAKETPSSVTIRRAKGEQDVILRSAIQSIRSLSVSPMPEGLEQEIDLRGMADLIAYIKSLGH
jgi:putative membrane-bound dehydrogenase-like protein